MKEYLNEKLHSGRVTTRILLARARLMEVRDWETPAMNDPKYFPFFYYLGTQIQPKKVFEIGFGLGLSSAALVQGCETVEQYVGFQINTKDYYYSTRLGVATLKEYYGGGLKVDVGNIERMEDLIGSDIWDLGMITQKVELKFLRRHLDKIWRNLSSEALIVVDHLQEDERMEIFQDWCKSISKEAEIYHTRNTLGIVQKG